MIDGDRASQQAEATNAVHNNIEHGNGAIGVSDAMVYRADRECVRRCAAAPGLVSRLIRCESSGLILIMRRDAKRTLSAVALLVVLFFSQLWVAAYACATVLHSTPANPVPMVVVPDTHGDLRDHHTAAVCQAHCDNSAQPGHAARPKPAPLFLIPLIWGASTIPELAMQPRLPTRPQPILLSTPPPPRILFQVFRN